MTVPILVHYGINVTVAVICNYGRTSAGIKGHGHAPLGVVLVRRIIA